MSVVIIGGNECMVCQYEKICKAYGCKAKVFAKERSGFKKKLGSPDLMILFTNTVSHKMVNSAVTEAKRNRIRVVALAPTLVQLPLGRSTPVPCIRVEWRPLLSHCCPF